MSRTPHQKLGAADLTRDGKLDPDAIEGCAADADAVGKALGQAATPLHQAALAVVAGLRGHAGLVPNLLESLKKDDLPALAAGWALGRLGSAEVEPGLRALIEAGKLGPRENGYRALATLAAFGKASPQLADAMAARVDAELARAKSGGTGLGDHALRVLAVLGDPRVDALAQKLLEGDRFADRIEIDRIRKRIAQDGRDRETIAARTGPWTRLFAPHVWTPPEVAPAVEAPSALVGANAPKPAAPLAPGRAAAPGPGARPAAPAPRAPPPPEPAYEDEAPGPDAPVGGPIDWAAFLASPEAKTVPAKLQSQAAQLGQLLEKVALQAIGVPLTDLTGQEFMALLLQVIPQSVPPQYVQLLLAPEALRLYEAVARYLVRTGGAASGAELVDAVRRVRQQLREQVKRSGILDGPDYSDPAPA